MIKRSFDDNALHGASLILSNKIFVKYGQLSQQLGYFITLQEFDKYVRYRSYGISEINILKEINNDISDFNVYTKNALPTDLEVWIAANFSNMLNFTLGYEEEEDDEE